MKQLFARIAFALCAASAASQADATLYFTFAEVGPDVVLTGSGSLNVDGFSPLTGFNSPAGLSPDLGLLTVGRLDDDPIDIYNVGLEGDGPFGTGDEDNPTGGSGMKFGFKVGFVIYVPAGYTSDAPLSGQLDFANESFASLGLTPGTYDYFYELNREVADRIHLEIVPTAIESVPEPASIALFGIGAVAVTGTVRRRRPAALRTKGPAPRQS